MRQEQVLMDSGMQVSLVSLTSRLTQTVPENESWHVFLSFWIQCLRIFTCVLCIGILHEVFLLLLTFEGFYF